MHLTKKTVLIGVASLLILGLAAWGVNLFLFKEIVFGGGCPLL